MKAFNDDPAVKTALLERFDSDAVGFPVSSETPATELLDWAERNALPGALVLLGFHLARGEPRATFMRDVIDTAPVGADLSWVSYRWAAWAWQDAPLALRHPLAESPFLDAGLEALSLHTAAAAGRVVERRTWRAARARLGMLAEEAADPAVADALNIMAAGSWDHGLVPAGTADMAGAWERTLMQAERRRTGWSSAEDERVQIILTDQRTIAEQQVGPAAPQETAEAHRKRLTERMLAQIDQLDEPLLRRAADVREASMAVVRALREDSRRALITLLRDRPPA